MADPYVLGQAMGFAMPIAGVTWFAVRMILGSAGSREVARLQAIAAGQPPPSAAGNALKTLAPIAAAAFTGLVAFWIPVFTPKGGRVHMRAGKVFMTCAYVVAGTALTIALLTLASPFGTHPEARPADPARAGEALSRLRFLEAFLGYLAIVTFATVWHGVRVMRTRRERTPLRTPFHTAVGVIAILAGAAILVLGLGDAEGIEVIAFGVVFPILLNTIGGVRAIPPELRDTASMLHLGAVIPNLSFAADAHYHHLQDDVIEGGKMKYENGAIRVPDAPGLGVRLDRDKLAMYEEQYRRLGSYAYDQDPGRPGWTPLVPNERWADPDDPREPFHRAVP